MLLSCHDSDDYPDAEVSQGQCLKARYNLIKKIFLEYTEGNCEQYKNKLENFMQISFSK